MKTRENELHEPKIEANSCVATVKCVVCNRVFGFRHGYKKEEAVKKVKECYENYCPSCGARLKEVEECKPLN